MNLIGNHQYLFEGAQSKVPAPFNPKVGVSLPGGICMHQGTSCGTVTRGRGELHILTWPVKNQKLVKFLKQSYTSRLWKFANFPTLMRSQAANVVWVLLPLCFPPSPLLTFSQSLQLLTGHDLTSFDMYVFTWLSVLNLRWRICVTLALVLQRAW